MKFRIVLLTLIFGVTISYAQVSLDINDFPSPGLELNVTEYYNGPLSLNDSIDVGSAGANGVYDISSVTSFFGESQIIEYMDPSQTPYGSFHPGANISQQWEIETDSATGDTLLVQYNYYDVDASGCTEYGISFLIDTGWIMSQNPSGALLEAHIEYNPGGQPVTTGYQMGFTNVDTSYWEVSLGGIYHSESVVKDINVDGYGQITTPDGVVDVLRVRVVTYKSMYTSINGNVVEDESDTTNSYEFWANDVGEALVMVRMNSDWSNIDEVNYTSVTKAGSGFPTSIDEREGLSYSIFPNPAKDQLRIQIASEENYKIDLFNILGDKVITSENESQLITLDVSHLQNGVYLLNIASENGVILRTEKVIINR